MKLSDTSDNLIPSIHNYCDRWCEKCPFIKRCSVGIVEIEFTKKTSGMDPKAKMTVAINDAKDHLSESLEMLNQYILDNKIDLSSMHNIKEIKATEDNLSIIQLAESYVKDLFPILTKIENLLIEDAHKQVLCLETGIKTQIQIENELRKNKNSYETIQQYMLMIPSKLKRSIEGKLNKLDFENIAFQEDWNGTAKLAKILTSRSIISWVDMLNYFPALETFALQSLSKLEKIRNYLNKEFQNTDKFIRPGFDTTKL